MTIKNYFYILMSQKDMLENQVLEEILRERANYYLSKNREIDFWLLTSPDFLYNNEVQKSINNSIFYNQNIKDIEDNLNNKFYSVLLTSNKEFIKWIKLRLGYFEDISSNILSKTEIKSDGLYGEINNDVIKHTIIKNKPNNIHPELISKKFKKSLEMIYLVNNLNNL